MFRLKDTIKDKSQWKELNTYIELIENNQDKNPNIALDGTKSLLETVSKTILEDKGIAYDHDENISKLVKSAFDTFPIFSLLEARDLQSAKAILGAFATIAKHLGEFRNRHGFFSHGQDLQSNKFDRYLVELVVSSSDLVTSFLIIAHTENLQNRIRSYYDENDEFNSYINDSTEEPTIILETEVVSSMALYTDKVAYKAKLDAFINDKRVAIDMLKTSSSSLVEKTIEENLYEFQNYFTDEESLELLNFLYESRDSLDLQNETIQQFINTIIDNFKEVISDEFQEKINQIDIDMRVENGK